MDPFTVAAIAAPTVAASIGGLFGKKKTVSQVPMETPEQAAARRMLTQFAQTGKFGDYTAGQDLGIPTGDYSQTPYEQQGLSSLSQLLSSGIPDQYKLGDAALRDLIDTSPAAIEQQFSPFKTQVERQIRDSNTELKRNAGFTGNLYSTDTVRRLGDIEARGNETLTSKLADLTDAALQRKASLIPVAYQGGQAQEALNMGRINASQQYGALPRTLNNADLQAQYQEALRRRSELQQPIDAAKSVAGTGVNYGVPSVTTNQSSPFQSVLDLAANIGGQYAGNQLFLSQYGKMFGTGAKR